MGIKQSRYHRQKQSPPRRESANTQTASGLSQSVNSITIDGRQYHNDQTSTYILPKDEIEQDRLNSVNEVACVQINLHITLLLFLATFCSKSAI
jgi:hypothetical protein